MLKKIICLIAVLAVIFSLTVSAKDDFIVYGEDDIELLCQALDMNAGDINDYCLDNNITYFAINNDNTKQIRRIEVTDAFSKKAVDLSTFTDDEVLALSAELSGFEGVKGTVVERQGYKFLKVELSSTDEGGEYVLTQYTTVKNAKRIVLAFYTAGGQNRDYIEEVFEEQFKLPFNLKPYIIIGVVLFAFAGIVTLAFIIKDFRKENPEIQETE